MRQMRPMRDAGDPIMDSGPTTPAVKGTQPLTKEEREAVKNGIALDPISPANAYTVTLVANRIIDRYEATVAELEARCAALEADREALIEGSVRAIYDDDWRVMNTETGLAADPRSFATADEALQAYHASRSRTPTTSTTIWRRAMSDPQPQRPVSEAPTKTERYVNALIADEYWAVREFERYGEPQDADVRTSDVVLELARRARRAVSEAPAAPERVRTAPPGEDATKTKTETLCPTCGHSTFVWPDGDRVAFHATDCTAPRPSDPSGEQVPDNHCPECGNGKRFAPGSEHCVDWHTWPAKRYAADGATIVHIPTGFVKQCSSEVSALEAAASLNVIATACQACNHPSHESFCTVEVDSDRYPMGGICNCDQFAETPPKDAPTRSAERYLECGCYDKDGDGRCHASRLLAPCYCSRASRPSAPSSAPTQAVPFRSKVCPDCGFIYCCCPASAPTTEEKP